MSDKNPTTPSQPFEMIPSIMGGFRAAGKNYQLFVMLSVFPFVVTFATLVAMRIFGENLSLFWLPIMQLPANFIAGLLCTLILRALVTAEHPLIEDADVRRARNRAALRASIAYAAVSYLITGVYAGLIKMRAFMIENPDAAAPYSPLAIAALVFVFWAARWFWLHVPLALEWDPRDFYKHVGRWPGSLRIFGLFAVCSLSVNLIAMILRNVVAVASGSKNIVELTGIFAAFDDAIVAMATVALAVVFSCVTSAAVLAMTKRKA